MICWQESDLGEEKLSGTSVGDGSGNGDEFALSDLPFEGGPLLDRREFPSAAAAAAAAGSGGDHRSFSSGMAECERAETKMMMIQPRPPIVVVATRQ
ncbi:hypothetical protein U1Q18_012770 [Sarracenia purpurea var. burkii]